MRKYNVISGDGHVEVPIDFSSRVPSKFKDIVPQLVRREDGTEYWKMGEAHPRKYREPLLRFDLR